MKINKIRILLSFSIGIGLLIFMFQYLDFEELLVSLHNMSKDWVIFSFGMLVMFYIVRAWRWRLLLSSIRNPVRLSNTFMVTILGFFVNTLIPIRLGEFLRAYLMSKKENATFFEAFSTIIVERVFDVLGIITLALIAFIFLPNVNQTNWIFDSLKIAMPLALTMLAILIISSYRGKTVLNLVEKISAKFPLSNKWKSKIYSWSEELINGFRYINTPIILFISFISSTLIWFFSALFYFSIFQALSFDIPFSVAILGGVLFELSFFLPSTPGFIGSFEVFWVLIFVGLGLSLEGVLPIGIIAHLLYVVFIVVAGCLVTVWYGLTFEELLKRRFT